MMTTPSIQRARAVPSARVRAIAVIVAVTIATAFLLGASCASEGTIERVWIVNRTPFDYEVSLSDAERESWQILGTAPQKSTELNENVADEGHTWVFRFEYGGKHVGDVTIRREELRRAGWKLRVPASYTKRMYKLGFEPPPR